MMVMKFRFGVVLIAALGITSAHAGPYEQAKRIHDRLTGAPPSAEVLDAMAARINSDGHGRGAARMAMDNDNFYRVTLKNFAAPWTNRDQSPFVPLNDYIALVMGLVRDGRDFREVLQSDLLYIGAGIEPAPAIDNNTHFETLENGRDANGRPFSYRERLTPVTQSSLYGLPANATAGAITSRAAARAFFIDGTNRAQLRFTLINHLCRDLEALNDTSLIPDRIRQDVSRSPGGDARAFLNGCVGCHSGMDPLAQAFAYYDFVHAPEDLTGERGALSYLSEGATDPATGSRVRAKYHINSATFPLGFVTPDDRWDNYWREGVNASLGWDPTLPGSGEGAKSLGEELAHSAAFSACQVEKVFTAVCLHPPRTDGDRAAVRAMTDEFTAGGYNLQLPFAAAADYCKGD